MNKLLMVVLLFFTATVCVQAEYKEGKEYKKITEQPTDSGDKIEILEFFWYGCPHCYQFEPHITGWLKNKPNNVEFVRVPVIFRPSWKIHGRMYYALQIMGVVEKLHPKIFNAMHKDKKKLDTEEAVTEFVVSQGVDKKEFTEVYSSFAVDNMVRKAIKKSSAYNVTGVPTVGINGKYITTGPLAGTYENLIRILEYLVKKESVTANRVITAPAG